MEAASGEKGFVVLGLKQCPKICILTLEDEKIYLQCIFLLANGIHIGYLYHILLLKKYFAVKQFKRFNLGNY